MRKKYSVVALAALIMSCGVFAFYLHQGEITLSQQISQRLEKHLDAEGKSWLERLTAKDPTKVYQMWWRACVAHQRRESALAFVHAETPAAEIGPEVRAAVKAIYQDAEVNCDFRIREFL